jgi:hypothetical protein
MDDEQKRAKAVEDILVFLSACRPAKRPDLSTDKPMSYFDGAFALDLKLGEVLMGGRAFIPSNSTIQDVDGSFDSCTLVTNQESILTSKEDAIQLIRSKTIKAPAVRGRIFGFRRHLVEVTIGEISPSTGLFVNGVNILGSQDGEEWTVIGPTSRYSGPEKAEAELADAIRLGIGLSIVRPEEWSVKLQFSGYPGVRFFTDPVGVREVFRLRDIPEGKSRREALRNWVTNHWRKKHDDPSALVEVRKHLRGATKFTWGGLRCEVEVARLDRIENREVVGLEDDGE